MIPRLRRFLDVRRGEGLPAAVSFSYIALVVAAFVLAKPIRTGLFLSAYGAYPLVYAYAAVPLALLLFLPANTWLTARFGSRAIRVGTLAFFSANVLLFWYLFRYHPHRALEGIFYVWVNCFGAIASVQAWTYAISLFDTRQAKRLFGPIGAGASLGAIAGGALARFLVEPVGGTVNMMLVLAGLILSAAGLLVFANPRVQRTFISRIGPAAPRPTPAETVRQIGRSPYLRLIVATVFLTSIVTQWTSFQLNLVAEEQFGSDGDALTEFFGGFNLAMGAVSFALQLFVTGPTLRKFGVGVTILLLPLALMAGSGAIMLAPGFVAVLVTNACDQGLRFSLDKATYELLYLPLARQVRAAVKAPIDTVVSGLADASGAVLLGVATAGFWKMGGLALGLKGTAAINLGLIAAWLFVAWRLRVEYVRAIAASIHRHRLESERMMADRLDRSAADVVGRQLGAGDPGEVRRALEALELRDVRQWWPSLRALLTHDQPDLRRRALALLDASGDDSIASAASQLLTDPDIGVRTAALLYLSRHTGSDPLRLIEELGDFEDFSIRAGMAAFLASPGPSQNVEAARAILTAMTGTTGPEGASDRREAARLLRVLPDPFLDLFSRLIGDEDPAVALEAIRSAADAPRAALVPVLLGALARGELRHAAADALAALGDAAVKEIAPRLHDEATPIEVRQELPGVLVRVGTPAARHALMEALLQADAALRHRVIASLNKIQLSHPGQPVDRALVELVLAAEIAGHYRSYQVMGALRAPFDDERVVKGLRRSMENELERIFRLLALLHPETPFHDAYIGVRSANPIVHANALEFLENVLKPELRRVLLPVLDSHVSVQERTALANRFVGAPLETPEQAVATLLASEDPWLRSCAAHAVGALQLHSLERDLRKLDTSTDATLRETVAAALQRLSEEEPPPQPLPAEMGIGL